MRKFMYSTVVHISPVTRQMHTTTNYCSFQVLKYVCRRIQWWRNLGIHCSRQLNCVGTHALGDWPLTSVFSSCWYSALTFIIRVHSVYILRQLLIKIIQNLRYDDWMCMEGWRNDTKTCTIPNSSTTNPTWTGLRINSGLCSKRPATNCVNHGMALSV